MVIVILFLPHGIEEPIKRGWSRYIQRWRWNVGAEGGR